MTLPASGSRILAIGLAALLSSAASLPAAAQSPAAASSKPDSKAAKSASVAKPGKPVAAKSVAQKPEAKRADKKLADKKPEPKQAGTGKKPAETAKTASATKTPAEAAKPAARDKLANSAKTQPPSYTITTTRDHVTYTTTRVVPLTATAPSASAGASSASPATANAAPTSQTAASQIVASQLPASQAAASPAPTSQTAASQTVAGQSSAGQPPTNRPSTSQAAAEPVGMPRPTLTAVPPVKSAATAQAAPAPLAPVPPRKTIAAKTETAPPRAKLASAAPLAPVRPQPKSAAAPATRPTVSAATKPPAASEPRTLAPVARQMAAALPNAGDRLVATPATAAARPAAVPVSLASRAPVTASAKLAPPPPPAAAMPADPAAAAGSVDNFLREAFRLVKSNGTTPLQRRAQLADLFSRRLDIGRIAGYTTADELAAMSPDIQQRFRTILISYLVETYYPRIELASDPAVTVETAAAPTLPDGSAVVTTTFTKSGWGSESVKWQLMAEKDGYRVVDIMSAGASLVQMERDTFHSVMRNGGLPELMAKLDARTKALSSAAP